MIAMDAHIRRNRDVVYADMNGDTVMFSLERDEYYGLNAIGTRIRQPLKHGISVQEICTILGSEYDVSDTQCRDDTRRFLQELLDHHVIAVS